MTIEAIYRQLKGTWRQYLIRHDRVNECRIERLIEELEPMKRAIQDIQQKAYERRYPSEPIRIHKMEEAKTKPSEYYNYTTLTERSYITRDRRTKKYFVQYINDNDKIKDERKYYDTLEEAEEEFRKTVLKITTGDIY